MKLVTIFKNFSIPTENTTVLALAEQIINGGLKQEVEQIRFLISQNRMEEAQILKKRLPAFTPSATFKARRILSEIDEYSGFVHLDFDGLTEEQLKFAFEGAMLDSRTLLCFRSPSGNGLKLIVSVDTGIEHHDIAYSEVALYYACLMGVKPDPKCKDITRLCFMSYDPELYFNKAAKEFVVNLSSGYSYDFINSGVEEKKDELQEIEETCLEHIDYGPAFEKCVLFTEKKKQYIQGSRNDFIYALASNCNRDGIPEKIALQFALDNFDLAEKEIEASFRSAYIHHGSEFGQLGKSSVIHLLEDLKGNDFLKETPSIPEDLFLKMPSLLRDGAIVLSDKREKDVFFTGALAILSGCMPGVKGVYNGQEVFPNVFTFTVAPPASGKGALSFSKMLGDSYHNSVLKISKEADEHYKRALTDFKQRLNHRKKGDADLEEEPIKPPFKAPFIPANTSYAKMLWHVEQNDGHGIICETEADTLGNVFKQEWGSYSDMLRKAFHHERVSSSRKQNNEFTEINSPRLSIALSGTPNQVAGLIASAEDGLFSRFCFYLFKPEQIWKDVSPNSNQVNLTEHFRKLSDEVFEMVKFLQTEETEICLTNEQWKKLNLQCKKWLEDGTLFTGEEIGSVVKRLGLILYRMAMIFTALRKFEKREKKEMIYCDDNDFHTAIKLAEVYLEHNTLMFHNLPKQQKIAKFRAIDKKQKFFESLPVQFTRHQAVEIGRNFQISTRIADELLHNAVDIRLRKLKAGHYEKI